MKGYEVMLAINPELETDELNSLLEKYKKIIQGKKGIIVKIDKWGKRPLAYEIKNFQQANYVLLSFDLDSKQISDLERIMRLDEKIIRYLLVLRQERTLPVKEKSRRVTKQEKKPEVEREKPEEEIENTQEE